MVEKTEYNVLKKIEEIEIRQYPELLLAVVRGYDDDTAFGLLFRYISGENKTQQKIPMTAPVITSEKISMTTPVISEKKYIAFVFPSVYNKANVPIPTNPSVHIESQPRRKVAALRFSGHSSDKRVQQFIRELLSILKNHAFIERGNPFLMRYNSPFRPGFLRRNEVAIEISEFHST